MGHFFNFWAGGALLEVSLFLCLFVCVLVCPRNSNFSEEITVFTNSFPLVISNESPCVGIDLVLLSVVDIIPLV